MAIIYKTLFEVKLLHEYYLTRKDGSSIFEKSSQQDRMTFLEEEFGNDQPAINNDIEFVFPTSLLTKYQGVHVKIVPSYSGCRLVARVNRQVLADNSIVFSPAGIFSEDLVFFILIKRLNSSIDNYSNSRINRPVPGSYFFTNENLTGSKNFPFLTASISAEDPTAQYEQGELSVAGTTVQQYFRQGGVDKWEPVTGEGFANENDRLLVPQKFQYYFENVVNLTEATFTLTDSNGDQVYINTINQPSGINNKTGFDVAGKVKLIDSLNSSSLDKAVYTLEVTGNNGYQAIHPLIFSDRFSSADPWAVIAIRPAVPNNAFNLFAPDGFLITRRDPLGTWIAAPVFEIPVKSRLAYWRYKNNRGKVLDISAALTDYVSKEGPALVTKKPRSVSKSWFFLRKENSTDTVYAPNPISVDFQIEADRRLIYDITVPQSELFPEAP